MLFQHSFRQGVHIVSNMGDAELPSMAAEEPSPGAAGIRKKPSHNDTKENQSLYIKDPVMKQGCWTVVRLDGVKFSKLSSLFKTKTHSGFSNAMQRAAERFATEFGASFAYVQSDEVTLFFAPHRAPKHAVRIDKALTVMSSYLTRYFGKEIAEEINDPGSCLTQRQKTDLHNFVTAFDARLFHLSFEDAIDCLLSRQYQLFGNAVGGVAHDEKIPERKLRNVNTKQRIEMLGDSLNTVPEGIMNGYLVGRNKVSRTCVNLHTNTEHNVVRSITETKVCPLLFDVRDGTFSQQVVCDQLRSLFNNSDI